jgi:hypothetical protein
VGAVDLLAQGRRGRRSLEELARELLVTLSEEKLNDLQGDLPPLDISDWDTQPQKIVDPVIRLVYNLSAHENWRSLEGYDMYIGTADDDTLNYVTVAEVAGRGVLTMIGASGGGSNSVDVFAKVTADAVAVLAETCIGRIQDNGTGFGYSIFQGFASTCKVEMRIDAASVINFNAAILLES